MASFQTLDDLVADVPDGARVLVRLDLNSPVEDGAVRDNRRFQRHAGTVAELADAGYRVVLVAHQSRPGRPDFVHLDGHADVLAGHLDRPVEFVADVHGEAALGAIRDLEPGEVLLLDNVRMSDDELPEKDPTEHAESDLVRTLAGTVDAYVNDAYSAAHRAHASLVGFPRVLPAYAGRVMVAEYEANTAIATREFDGPVTMVIGGVKATDVIGVMEAMTDRVDTFCLGGIAGELFLRAEGHPVGSDVGGTDLYDDQWEANEATIRTVLDEYGDNIRRPVDLAFEDGDGERAEVALDALASQAVDDAGAKARDFLDVGHGTVEDYEAVVRDSAAVFVKGALGKFEDERFSHGTVGVLEAIAETDCFSVVGGGDTSRAVDLYGLDPADFSHLSIAGGAYLRALSGEPLVAVEELTRGN